MTDLDDSGGWPDEPPTLDDSVYFDACDLEDYQPSEADEAWRLEQITR